jgi:ABC-type uncharacterized transport system substrate-binding protein
MSALAHETPMIPVVFVYVADPIGFGFAASFAHSGGNMTGSAKLTEYCIDNPDDDLMTAAEAVFGE